MLTMSLYLVLASLVLVKEASIPPLILMCEKNATL